MNNDNLLYGKSNLKRIVGLEITDDKAVIFIQDKNGVVNSVSNPHQYWILSELQVHKDCKRLDGDLHYKWAKRFTNRKQFEVTRSTLKNANYDIYSIWNSEEACMVKDGYTFFRDMEPKEVSLLSFDLETTGLKGDALDAKILLISTTYRDFTGQLINKLFSYDEFKNEKEMIEVFCNYVTTLNPSLIIGHNIISFDFPYLAARAKKSGATLNLGRDGSEIQFASGNPSKFRLDGTRNLEYYNVKIYGREIVDTYFLAVSFDVSKLIESYALKPMIKQLGMEKSGRQFYDAASIRDNYTNPIEWGKIKQYAVEDAEDAVKLWDYMGPLYFRLCPHIPKPLSEVLLGASGSKINAMMVRAYLQDAHSIPKGDIIPPKSFKGAISFSVPGIYDNCYKIDLEAIYPNVILKWGVYDCDKDPKKYLIELCKIFLEKRLEYKTKAAETGDSIWIQMDTTAKSILNSFYGFLAASGLNFNSLECAAFITEKAREILKYTIKYFSGKGLSEFIPEEEETFEEIDV